MVNLKQVIQKVRLLRKQFNMSQKEFGEHIGVSLATITRWGRGDWEYVPSLLHLSRMADLFDMTVSELLDTSESEKARLDGCVITDETAAALPIVPEGVI